MTPAPVAHDSQKVRRAALVILVAGAITLGAMPARAHFVLQRPAAWQSQDASGNPQKLGPCGDEGGGTPTGTVTAFQPGQTITVTIQEVVFHPGHYRIALATNSRSELPAEPVVTAGTTPCGSVPIASSPVLPVLADGVLQHTTALSGPQSIQVTLPANVTCNKCTLQIIEFMSNHPLNNPGGCFYHHCADISIQAAEAGGATGTGGIASAAGGRGAGGTAVGGTTGGGNGLGAAPMTGGNGSGGNNGLGGAFGTSSGAGGDANGGTRAGGGTPANGGTPLASAGSSSVDGSDATASCSCRMAGTKKTIVDGLGLVLPLVWWDLRRRRKRPGR